MPKPRALLLLLLALSAAPAHAARAEPLAEDAHVTKMLTAAQIGDILRNNCPKATARMFVVFNEMAALIAHAKGKGHSEATIRAFIADPAEKARIRKLADDHLAKAGVKPGDAESYCAVARGEVASGSVAGRLLRVAP
jgi:NADPH-dependent ferric siderophore reductase